MSNNSDSNEIRNPEVIEEDLYNDEGISDEEMSYYDEYFIQQHLLEKKKDAFQGAINKFALSSSAPKFSVGEEHIQKTYYSTGFDAFDEMIGGGFTAGLTALGAVSSLGKSTFALQIAHNLAAAGHHVLFFSLEMKREDITAKAISRQLYVNNRKNRNHHKSLQELYSLEAETTTESLKAAVQEAINELEFYDQNLVIIEPRDKVHLLVDLPDTKTKPANMSKMLDVSFTAEQIVQCVKNYMRFYKYELDGEKPFVFIDYLQIIEPDDKTNRTDKQSVDSSLKKFKTLADEEDIPIFLINSFNRESYSEKASMRSFKDSGNIEYSADLLLGLQFQNAGEPGFDIDREKSRPVRKVELVILKQRYGETGTSIAFDFIPKYNYFEYVPSRDKDSIVWSHKGKKIFVSGLSGGTPLREPLNMLDDDELDVADVNDVEEENEFDIEPPEGLSIPSEDALGSDDALDTEEE